LYQGVQTQVFSENVQSWTVKLNRKVVWFMAYKNDL